MELKIILLLVFAAIFAFGIFLDILSYRYKNIPIPANVADIYDEESYKKQMEYKREHKRLEILDDIFNAVFFLCILIFNVYSLVFDFFGRFFANEYAKSILMLLTLMLIDLILDIPFNAVKTFKIEQKYGFNKSTVKTFISDFIIKSVFLLAILVGIIALFMALYTKFGYFAFFVLFGVVAALMLVFLILGRQFAKVMNKFKPLEDGELKTKIEELAFKEGFSLKKISVINASKRSTKANAYCSGIGKLKSIVLYDTLIESASTDEIVAILAHEIGHVKHGHIIKKVAITMLQYAVMIALACFVVVSRDISLAFGFKDLNIAFGFIMFFMLYAPIGILLSIPTNILSRKYEKQADYFAVTRFKKEPLVGGLKKLSAKNYANLMPHPFIVLIEYSHPPLSKRLEYIDSIV